MVEDALTSALESLAVRVDAGEAILVSRLLKGMLESKRDYDYPLGPSEAVGLLGRTERGGKLSKVTAKRTLRKLVEIGLVEMTAGRKRRTGYFTDKAIVESGIRRLARRVKSEIAQEIDSIHTKEEAIGKLDCAVLAQDLVEELTGHRHRISSRLITGNEDIRRAVGYNIGDVAGKGDVIRVTITSPRPFLDDEENLIDEIARGAHKGADVRCLLYGQLTNVSLHSAAQKERGTKPETHGSNEGQESAIQTRMCDEEKAYHAVTLGDQYMALVVSENPATVAWITREFNPDIIDTSNSVFDDIWQDAACIMEGHTKGISSMRATAERLEREERPSSRAYGAMSDSHKAQNENEQIAEVLDLIGLNPNQERFSVLRIALQKQRSLGIPTNFGTIYQQIKMDSGKKDIPRSQVYRSLVSLENDGYIRGDRTSHPFRYAATSDTLVAALSDAEAGALRRLRLQRVDLSSEIERMKRLNLARLAADTVQVATGIPPRASASFAEGHDQIWDLVDREVYSVARKGDTIRVSLGWIHSTPKVTQIRIDTLAQVIKHGARVRVLLSRHWEDNEFVIAILTGAYESLVPEKQDVSVRVRRTADLTYQIVSRNRDGLVLVVSEEPPAAIYIPRAINERLVDDAIASFDAEFDAGTNLHSRPKGR